MADDAERQQDTTAPRPATDGFDAKRAFTRGLGIAALALFVAFAIANRQRVDFNWLFGETLALRGGGVPLIALLIGAFLLGAIAGGAVMQVRARRRRRSG